jgi:flagellar biosynthesis/type III secretory pathway protein FliH
MSNEEMLKIVEQKLREKNKDNMSDLCLDDYINWYMEMYDEICGQNKENYEQELAQAYKTGYEKGLKVGEKKLLIRQVCIKLLKAKSFETIMNESMITEEEFFPMLESIKKNASVLYNEKDFETVARELI